MIDSNTPVRTLFGVPVHAMTIEQAVNVCEDSIRSQRSLLIGAVNAAKIVHMRTQRQLRESLMAADLVIADGMSVVWASRLLGQPLPERVAGIDLFTSLIELADRKGYSVYFLGGEQSVLDEMIRRTRSTYPHLHVAGRRHGYFDESEATRIAGDISSARPDMLFVGITSPMKEIFLSTFGDELNVPVCHGVGGSFDILAGKVKRAPPILRRIGLEWFYRVVQEPRRLWKRYLVTNTIFAWMVLAALVARILRRRAPRVPSAGEAIERPAASRAFSALVTLNGDADGARPKKRRMARRPSVSTERRP